LGPESLRDVRPVPEIGELLGINFLHLNQGLHQRQGSALELRISISMKGQ